MKPIDRTEVLGLAGYEVVRERFRTRVIAEKKRRRVQLGPNVSVLFENRDTTLLQIQEMIRTERITRPSAIQHEIDTYNENLAGDDELCCTLMIEIVDPVERDAFLRAAVGFERHVSLVVLDERVAARAVAREGQQADRTTAVHYLKFPLPDSISRALRAARTARTAPEVVLRVDHPIYQAEARLPPESVVLLGEDLRE
ncbi:MAG TPA: DUF3501 family protein [Polyangiaceae bacterium]|nr:DUF3501 family protein [Polyangiaceae bacterium]